VAINQQIIEIVTKFTDGASKKIREVHQRMEELGGGMQRVTNTTRTLNKETNRLRKSMSVHNEYCFRDTILAVSRRTLKLGYSFS